MEEAPIEGAEGRDRSGGGPVRVIARDHLERTRLTVFFRFFLALPHFVWLILWSGLMVLVAVVNWFAVLLRGRPIAASLTARYVRYYTHVISYLSLGANPFPGFSGTEGAYPIDVEVPDPERQSRWKAALRLVLAIPAILIASVFGSFGAWYVSEGGREDVQVSLGIIAVAAFLGWFVSLARGRMAQGLRDLIVYAVGYLAQVVAYLLLMSDSYPNSDPLAPRYGQPAPDHPIRIAVEDDLRRSRLTVFFRFLLWLPHMVWLFLWGIAVFFAAIANWFVALFAGRPAAGLRGFITAYVRYATHATSFVYLVANPFPGFTGEEGSYPIDLRIAAPERQSRWKTGFRLILVVPAMFVAGALSNALMLVAVFGWFVGLIQGRMPQGLRNLGAFAVRYNAQTWAYLLLVTDRYPFGGPSLELLPDAALRPQGS